MKSKLTLALVTTWMMAVFFAVPAFSATFSLTKIGSLDLAGKKYSEWWYTGLNPTFYGTTEAGAMVTVSANAEEFTGKADVDGNWAIPTTLAADDYDMSISDDTEDTANLYLFTLHLGQNFPGTSGTSQTSSSTTSGTVPDTGVNQTTAILFGTGVSLLAMYFYFFESNKKRTVFEKRIISE